MCFNMVVLVVLLNLESDEVDELFLWFMFEVLVSLIFCIKFNVYFYIKFCIFV